MSVPSTQRDPLRVSSAVSCVPAAPDAVWTAVLELSAELGAASPLVEQRPGLLIQPLSADGTDEVDGWLTWTITALSATDVRVAVCLAEFDDAAPEPELDLLLCRLVERLLAGRASV
jgi:hypothetical protein